MGDWFFSLKQDYEKAELFYQEARIVAAKLLSAHPEDQAVRVNLADAWYHLGDLRDRRGDKLGTLEAFENELKTTQPLETSAKGNVQTLLDASISYDHLSRINTDLKRWDEVITVVSRAMAIRGPLLDADPTNRRAHSLLSRPTERLGLAYRNKGQLDKAIDAYELTLKRVASYVNRTGDHSLDASFDSIRTALAQCRAERAGPVKREIAPPSGRESNGQRPAGKSGG